MYFIPALPLIILGAAVIANTLLAILVTKNNPKSVSNRLLSLLSIITTIWLIVSYLGIVPEFFSHSLLLSRLSIFFAVPQVTLFFLFAHTTPYEKIQMKNQSLFLLLIVAIGILFLTISPFAFVTTQVVNGQLMPVPGWGMGVFALYALFYSIGAIYTLIKRWKLASGVMKQQLWYVMFGILIMLGLLIFTILIPVVVANNLSFEPFIPLYTLAFLGLTSYAIVKHRLMDVRLLAARTASYTLLVFLATSVYVALLFTIGDKFSGLNLTASQFVILSLITIIAAFSFHPLQRILEQITDRIFFQNRYDTDKVLGNLSNIMAFALRLDDVAHGILEELLPQLHITKGAFILFDEGQVTDVRSQGFLTPPYLDEENIKTISQTRNTLVFDELEEGAEKNILRSLGLTVAAHLRTEGKQIGLLVLGEKSSGDIYSQQDLDVIEILASEAAVAIENALAFEEIRRFNVTLKEEVDRATADLTTANKQLEILDNLKNEFVSLASHELRTPMTAIKSYAWLVLNNKAGPLEPKARQYLNRVFNSTERLIHLVNEMLDISRIESGKVQLKRENINLRDVARDIQSEFQAKTAELHLTLSLDIPDNLPPVSIDREKIHQVFENLVGNACKFTPPQGMIRIVIKMTDTMVETSVIDSGRGIHPEDMSKLFTKFGRLEGSYITITGSGSGLGLYICKQYVELHGGTISATSEPGKGSAFTFTLPIAQLTVSPALHKMVG